MKIVVMKNGDKKRWESAFSNYQILLTINVVIFY